jgi:alkanesulfonate monooxygenase SsuD/methylene tetrahydromethanopterin reductase-like flavin-dependent oxidoreductase (luciferase family)
VLAGTGEEVHQQLEALQAQYGIEEFVIDSPVSQSQARLRSLELLASASVALA